MDGQKDVVSPIMSDFFFCIQTYCFRLFYNLNITENVTGSDKPQYHTLKEIAETNSSHW